MSTALRIPTVRTMLGSEQVDTVNARDLYTFLEVGRDFSTWIKGRIDEYEFVEGEDYIKAPPALPENGEAQPRGLEGSLPSSANRVDYFLSLDMAKELCMVERTQKGRECRRYFIAVEKQFKESQRQELHTALSGPLWDTYNSLRRLNAEMKEALSAYAETEVYLKVPDGYQPERECYLWVARGLSLVDFHEMALKLCQTQIKIRRGKRVVAGYNVEEILLARNAFISELLMTSSPEVWYSPTLKRNVVLRNPRTDAGLPPVSARKAPGSYESVFDRPLLGSI